MNFGSNSESRLKDRFREATRAAILDAAEKVFGLHGITGARVDDIAAAAGVSVGTLYNHFGDRQQLLDALLEDRRNDLNAHLDEPLRDGTSLPFSELLETYIRGVLRHFDAHRTLFQLLMEEEALQLRCRERKSAMAGQFIERTERLIRYGVEQQALRADDAAHFPVFLAAIVRGTIARAKCATAADPVEHLAPALVRFFLSGARA